MFRQAFLRLLLIAGLALAGRGAEPQLLNGVAAIVNQTVITVDEVQGFSRRALEAVARRVRNQAEFDAEAAKITKDALEQLIDRRLIIDEFQTAGYTLPDTLVEDIVKEQIRDQFGDRLTLVKGLRARGQNYETFRNDQRDAFIVAQMILRNINQQIVISPKKLERYYAENREKFRVGDRVRLRMILVDASRHARGEPVKRAAAALEKIGGGADFAEVANEFSDDARRFKGGERGWIEDKDADLRPELREVAFRLEQGQVSEVIELGGTAFILKAEERSAAQVRPLSEVREEIETALTQAEKDRLQKAWLARLRQKAFIRYY